MLETFLVAMAETSPPDGGLSPLAWTLIVALATTLVTVTGVLWKDRQGLYADLKACQKEKSSQDEEILGLLKVIRLQMEDSKGGRPR